VYTLSNVLNQNHIQNNPERVIEYANKNNTQIFQYSLTEPTHNQEIVVKSDQRLTLCKLDKNVNDDSDDNLLLNLFQQQNSYMESTDLCKIADYVIFYESTEQIYAIIAELKTGNWTSSKGKTKLPYKFINTTFLVEYWVRVYNNYILTRSKDPDIKEKDLKIINVLFDFDKDKIAKRHRMKKNLERVIQGFTGRCDDICSESEINYHFLNSEREIRLDEYILTRLFGSIKI
jgi:hypothetical protein